MNQNVETTQHVEGQPEPTSTVERLMRIRETKRETEAKPQEPAPQAKIEGEPKSAPEPKTKPDEPSLRIEDALKEIEALKAERARLEKQAADSRKWGNEQNMKLKALMKEGAIDEDVATQLASNEAALSDSPFEAVGKRWDEDLKRLRPVLAKRGENVDDYREAFSAWLASQSQESLHAIADEILALPQDEWTTFMLEKGRDYHDSFYSEVKQNGSLIDAYKAAKEKSAKLEAENAALKEQYNALKAEMADELKSGYGKKATLNSSAAGTPAEDDEPRPLSKAAMLEQMRNMRLGLVR